MKKAQGSLEYLIIVAAVLAIAAVVVLFLSGTFKGASGGTVACKNEASQCSITQATTTGHNCTSGCITACTGTDGKDVIAKTVVPTTVNCVMSGAATGCANCSTGSSSVIG